MYKKLLEALDLEKREIEVVLALLARGNARAGELADDTGLPRQTVNSILSRLAHEGIIVATSGKGVRRFACDYAQLARYLDSEQERIHSLRKSLSTGNEAPVTADRTHGSLPMVTYYEGAVGLERLFKSMLELFRKGKVRQFRGYGVNFLAGTKGLEAFIRYFLRERARLGVSANLFIAKGPDDFKITGEATRLRRNIKHLDIDEQNAGIYIVGNRLYLFSYKENVGVMIENPSIASFLKGAFDDHWDKSR